MVSNTERTIIYYNFLSNGYRELYWEEQKNKLKILNSFYNLKKIQNKRILDCGAGDGILNDFINLEKNVLYSLDVSYKMLLKNDNNKKILANICKIPFKNETFHIIVSITVIQDIDDYKKAIVEIKRILKKNGILIISILKKSPRLKEIKEIIKKNFKIIKKIEEKKDLILFCKK